MQFGTRRRFLLVSAGLGAAAGLGGVGWLLNSSRRIGIRQDSGLPGVSESDGGNLARVSRTSWALGSNVTITVLHDSPEHAEQAIDAAFAELETVERVMSLYRPQSELCRLNRSGVLDNPHPYLVDVLNQAESVARASGGAFDVTVQPLWQLYAAANKEGRLPDAAAVEMARSRVDWRRVRVSARRITLDKGTTVTLNGIAQGFAADRAMAALRAAGIEHALVDTGEISPLGTKEQGDPWQAGIQHPRESDAYVALARLDGRCLATSGDYATTFSPDRKYNHLFDPRTGNSPDELASVSIAAPTAMQADALSTAVFVLGPVQGLDLVERQPGVDALFVLKDGRTRATGGFPLDT